MVQPADKLVTLVREELPAPSSIATSLPLRSAIPNSPGALLTRKKLAAALREFGYPISDKTLATKASRGGGPPFQRWGAIPLYIWGASLVWAQSRLGPVVTSTSELDGSRPRLNADAPEDQFPGTDGGRG
jgi:hypothetical protein